MDFANYWYSSGAANPESDPGDPIGESLRLLGFSTSLTRQVTAAGNRRTFTLSTWLKRSSFNKAQQIFSQTQSGTAVFDMYFDTDNRIQVYQFNSSTYQINCLTNARYRDPAAWYHVVLRVDTTSDVQTDRVRLYVNGILQSFETATWPSLNFETYVNQANNQDMAMGQINSSVASDGQPYDGYFAQTYYVDGQSLGPEEFGRLNALDVWVPVDYTGTYGVNGYRFDYDGTDWQGPVLKDKSGNGNDFTYSGVGLNIAVADYGISKDTPTNNFSTLNPLITVPWGPNGSRYDAIYEAGALRARNTASGPSATISTSFIPNKFYFEVGPTTDANNRNYPGLIGFDIKNCWTQTEAFEFNVLNIGQLRIPGQSNTTPFDPWFQNDIARVLWDSDTRILQIAINDGAFKSADLSSYIPAGTKIGFGLEVFNNDGTGCINFGSKAFQYDVPAGYNDGNYKNQTESFFNNGREQFRCFLGSGESNINAGPGQRDGDFVRYLSTNNTDGMFQQAPQFAFNGLTGDPACMSGNVNGLLTWAPATDVTFSGNLEVFCMAGNTTPNYIAAWNGNQVNYVHNTWVTVATGGGTINASQPLTIQADPSDQAALAAIRLDGEILVDFGLMGSWSSGVTAKTGSINVNGGPPTRLFNGKLDGTNGSYFAMNGVNDVMRWVPTEEVIINDRLIIYPYTGHIYTYVYSIDGVEYTTEISTTGQYGDPYLITTQTGTLEYLEISGYYATTLGIEVDGRMLIDNSVLSLAKDTFPNGIWWIKERYQSTMHQFVDSVRGGDLAFLSPDRSAELPYEPRITDCVAWCWNLENDPVTNNDGSIATNVSVNKEAGVSAMTYTGTGANATIGHGLDKTPDFYMVKWRNGSDGIHVWHRYMTSANNYMFLDQPDAQRSANDMWNNTLPNDSVINLGINAGVNGNGGLFVAYAWHEVPGYSAMGDYSSNGNNNGPFIYTGFKPAWVMCKRLDSSANWIIYDTQRSRYNPAQHFLYPSSSTNEQNAIRIDINSNGFKPRDVSDPVNRSGRYIYVAFAENPFGGTNTVPPTAG